MRIPRHPHRRPRIRRGALIAAALAQGCAGNYLNTATTSTTASNPAQQDAAAVKGSIGARVSFHESDFFSLSAPRSDSSCAGDARTFYHPLLMTLPSYDSGYLPFTAATGITGPLAYPLSQIDSSMSVHPEFIANVSVDLTNAASQSSLNQASSCSLGTSPTAPPVSACASFDRGTISGMPTPMGGTMLLVGGLRDSNYSGINTSLSYRGMSLGCGPANADTSNLRYNRCDATMYSLAIDSLPPSAATNPPSAIAPGVISASGPLSMWSNISGVSGYSGPQGLAGAAIAYNSGTQRLLTFSGASPFASTYATVGPTGAGAPHADTWAFDIKSQKWTTLNANAFVDPEIQRMYDYDPGTGNTQQWQKPSGSRASFGMVAAQGFALQGMSTNQTVAGANIDLTDRILIVGGLGSFGYDTRKFNPTYGPDWVDTPGAAGVPTQWLDSFHTQQTFNHTVSTGYLPGYNGAATGSTIGVNFGLAPARNNGGNGAGYLYAVGGHVSGSTINATRATGGALNQLIKNGGTETATANFSGTPALLNGVQVAPSTWSQSATAVAWYGGTSLVPGFNVSTNDMIYFGGSDCTNYLSTAATGCSFDHPSAYYRMGASPGLNPASTQAPASAPARAGMASARGQDGGGNVIVVAYGGVTSGAAATDNKLYYLYNTGTLAAPVAAWATTNPASAAMPTVVADAAMVYSHVTGKFYLFGGTNPVASFVSAETWELTVAGTCAAAGTCTFSWKKLDSATGLSCLPNCPAARRSHRMVEANYYNRNPGGSVTADGETTCTAAAPCSYGLFMQGGTSDGSTYLADRWMFDPTANGGRGHWQLMGELPPRTLASMASVDYFVPSQNKTVHRAILFGGETGMQNPALATGAGSFVPPTLGDTWMYDFESNSWHRVNLLGKGYNMALPSASFASEADAREAYTSSAPSPSTISELSPPPLSGAMMVARTGSNPTHVASGGVTPLKIPEIFLFGGRTKDGSFNFLNRVYKFCAGSTGEKPYLAGGVSQKGTTVGGADDASCDAFDSTTNAYSPSPTAEYIGRWIRKQPPAGAVTPSDESSFLGAAAYDSIRDLIVVIGGLRATTAATPVTDTALAANTSIFEYTPPSSTNGAATAINGSWAAVALCTGSPTPTARYGHSLTYDPLHQQLVMVGGYSATGATITQSQTYYDGRVYAIPEIWVAKRTDSATPCYTWSQITQFGSSIDQASQVPPLTGMAHAAAIFVPSDGFNSGFYSLYDHVCEKAGPISISDPSINKLMAGGAYFDLDRSQLGENENLLLHLTYIPMGSSNQRPDGTVMAQSEAAIFKVHLVKTGLTTTDLRLVFQPRYMTFADTDKYPMVAQTLSILAPPTGQVRQDQVLIPIASDPTIDRIRIERYSGSGILIDAALYRLGDRK